MLASTGTVRAQPCRICRPALGRAAASAQSRHSCTSPLKARLLDPRVRVRRAPTAARALPSLPSLPTLVIRPQGLIFEAVFAAAALMAGGIAASVFGLVFSSVFSVFAIAAAVGGIIWISTVALTGAIALGVGAVFISLAVAAVGGKSILGGGKQVAFGSDAIREAQEKIRDAQSEYTKGEFVWKDGVGSFQKGQPAAKRGKVVDIKLDPEEAEAAAKEEALKEERREMQDELSDFDKRLRGQ